MHENKLFASFVPSKTYIPSSQIGIVIVDDMERTDLPVNSHKNNLIYETGREFFVALCSENETNERLISELAPYNDQNDLLESSKDLVSTENDNVSKQFNLFHNCENLSLSLNSSYLNIKEREGNNDDGNSKKYPSENTNDDEMSGLPSPEANENFKSNQSEEISITAIAVKTSKLIDSFKRTKQQFHNLQSVSDNSNTKGPFKCPICLKLITRKYNFNLHLVRHATVKDIENKPVECNICHKYFPQKRLMGHMNVHTKPHLCNICGRGFRLLWDLKHHIFTHTGERPYPCDYCGKKFGDKSARRKHYQTHTGEKPHSCEICQKSFSQLSHLREHQVTHTREKVHECELCGKRFTTKSSLQRHVITHTNTCDVCNETFGSESNLAKHKELHNTERPYACTICEKRFVRKADVYNHTKMHTAEKNKLCTVCNSAFKSSKSLRIHHYNLHPNIAAPYSCSICHRKYFVDRDLNQHLLLHKSENASKNT